MVALAAGDSPIDWTAMVEFLRANAPHYMVPRYFRQLQALPRNESGKVRKAELRAEGITADTWDREVAGIRIKAGKVGGP
jgi:crotonobetaine/carnitine-CoA ligase